MGRSELKNEKIYQHVANLIRSGKYNSGEKLPTESELAESFNVGRQTVLLAMRKLAAEGLIDRRQGSGTFVGKNVQIDAKPGRAGERTIAFQCCDLEDSMGHSILLGVEEAALSRGYGLKLYTTKYDISIEAANLNAIASDCLAGLVMVPYMPPSNLKLVEELVSKGTHVVCVDIGFENTNLPLVSSDNFNGAYNAVNYLVKHGHERIGFIISMLSRVDAVDSVRDRFLGYMRALKDNNIRFDKSLIQELGPVLSAKRPVDVGLEIYGYEPMHKLLSLKRPPTAVLGLWDEIIPGAMNAVLNAGLKVPEDVSFIGWNDDAFAPFLPAPLTSVRQPGREMGFEAAKILIDLIEGKKCINRRLKLPTWLIERRSVCDRNRTNMSLSSLDQYQESEGAVAV